MKLKTKLELKAFASHFELACIFGMIVIATDMFWLSHDIRHNGLNVDYVIVLTGLLIGLIGTAYVTWRHNKIVTKGMARRILEQKLKEQRAKRKRGHVSTVNRSKK